MILEIFPISVPSVSSFQEFKVYAKLFISILCMRFGGIPMFLREAHATESFVGIHSITLFPAKSG
jgi:hypothetical protein